MRQDKDTYLLTVIMWVLVWGPRSYVKEVDIFSEVEAKETMERENDTQQRCLLTAITLAIVMGKGYCSKREK